MMNTITTLNNPIIVGHNDYVESMPILKCDNQHGQHFV